ncbi:PaaI family thioesterase [Agrococcus citreus]|uniref:Thioesterase domain-containing protein n=1 Tax=Agrococcus citreus TaxID=84643 RepID=A0ABP4JHZ8_9MICO
MSARLRPQRQDHRLEVLMATPLHGYMGLREADPADPSRGLELTVDPKIANNSGMLHGGMVATALDVAAAYAIFPELGDDEVVLTNSLSISYLRPAPLGSAVWARAQILRRGRATAFLRSEVGIGDKLIATAQVVKAIVTLEEE